VVVEAVIGFCDTFVKTGRRFFGRRRIGTPCGALSTPDRRGPATKWL